MKNSFSPALLTIAVAGLAIASPANAATISSKYKINASGNCQGALPAGPGAVLRARPLAVQNEGTINATATCSFPYNDEAGEMPTSLGLRLINNNTSARTITCTLVSGVGDGTTVNYVTKSVSVAANAANSIGYSASNLPGSVTVINAPNLSCGLPPGTGITYIYYYYNRQIGN